MSPPTVLITGVSTGIGATTARYLLDRGFFVYGSVRRGGDAGAMSEHTGFVELVFDVTDREAIRAGIRQIREEGRQLTALVNNAGIAVTGPLETLSEATYRKQFDVNVFGLLAVVQEALPELHRAREAKMDNVKIINVSSVSGYLTSPFTSMYSASKFAVESLTDGLRRELHPFGIDVISVAPGPVKTPIWAKGREQTAAFEGNRYSDMLEKLGPYTRAAEEGGVEPEEVAQAIHHALTQSEPKPDVLVMRRSWLARMVRLLPKRTQDGIFLKRLRDNRRY